jgi:hypothetical protein
MNYEIKVSYTSIDLATGKEKTFKEAYLVTNADTIDEAQSIAVNYVAAFALNVRAISAKESRITECLNAIS